MNNEMPEKLRLAVLGLLANGYFDTASGIPYLRLDIHEAELKECRDLLKLAHDKMFSWFSSEYASHPDTAKITEYLKRNL